LLVLLRTNMRNLCELVLLFCLLALAASSYGASGMDIRIQHESIDLQEAELEISIQVRVHERIILGGQNYRIYYPTSALSLNTFGSESMLDENKYTDLIFVQIFEHAQALGVGNISFENDLGLVSMYIDLKDLEEGGLSLTPSDKWVSLAKLKFDIIGEFKHLEMILARPEISKEYATAFTEFTTWTAPYKGRKLNISQYSDYYFELQSTPTVRVLTTSIGPNPSQDYMAIRLNQEADQDLVIKIYDLNGREVLTDRVTKYDTYHIIDLRHLNTATYILAVNKEDQLIASNRIIVAR